MYGRYIKDELKTIQAFLRAAEVEKKKDESLKVGQSKYKICHMTLKIV